MHIVFVKKKLAGRLPVVRLSARRPARRRRRTRPRKAAASGTFSRFLIIAMLNFHFCAFDFVAFE